MTPKCSRDKHGKTRQATGIVKEEDCKSVYEVPLRSIMGTN